MNRIRLILLFLFRHRFIVLLVLIGGFILLYYTTMYMSPSYRAAMQTSSSYMDTQTLPSIGYEKSNDTNRGIDTGMLYEGDETTRVITEQFSHSEKESLTDISENTNTLEHNQRMIKKHINLSILVESITESVDYIETAVSSFDGFIVEKTVDNPEGAGTASISIRVPVGKADELTRKLRQTGVKVQKDNSTSSDITAQFKDIGERIAILENNKARFEEIMLSASDTEDILRIQEKIFTLQDQIDALKGQEQFLAESSKYSKIEVYLFTNDTTLPTSVNESWNTQGVVKQALSALTVIGMGIATVLIWVGVFSVVWIPLLVVGIVSVRYIKKRRAKG